MTFSRKLRLDAFQTAATKGSTRADGPIGGQHVVRFKRYFRGNGRDPIL